MLKYIFIFLLGFSATYAINHKFTNPIDMPNTYVASHNEYYIQVDRDSLVVYKDEIPIYRKSFQNCTQIIKSDLDSFRFKRFYDHDKIDTILFYSKLDLFDKNKNNIAEISISREKLSIIINKKVKEIEFTQPNSDKFLDNNVNLSIEWSSFYGGSNNEVLVRIFKNSVGDIVIGGYASSSSINGKLPITPLNNAVDIMLMTLSQDGDIKWLTYIGSGNDDFFYSLAIDKDDNIWVSGETRASNFYTKNAVYNNYSGGTADGVICKFSKDGDVIFSTYMGGNSYDALTDIAYNKFNDRIYCTGRSNSDNFPQTSNGTPKSRFTEYETPFVIFDNKTNDLVYSSMFGSKTDQNSTRVLGYFMKVDKNGDIVMVGYTSSWELPLGSLNNDENNFKGWYDAFVAKFEPDGTLKWARYLGDAARDYASCFAIDSSNNIIINMITKSIMLSTYGKSTALTSYSLAGLDNYLVKLSTDGDTIWGGYFGGNGDEGYDYDDTAIIRSDMVVTPTNDIFFTFFTTSTDLKVDNKSIYNRGFGNTDIFLLALDSNANYLASTYLGGTNSDTPSGMLLDSNKLYLVGFTSSTDFPIVNRNSKYNGGANDGFLVCFNTKEISYNPPKITDIEIEDCSEKAVYYFRDDNKNSGFKPNIIYKNENCNISSVSKLDSLDNSSILVVSVEKINNSKNAYYKFETINFADKSIIIEDSLLSSAEQLIRFEPNDLVDFGEHSIYNGQYCQNITIFNDGQSDYTINDAYFKENINFSFPPSQLPFVIPANSSREFTICVSPKYLNEFDIRDTFLIVNPCVDLLLPAQVTFNFPDISLDSKCYVPISIKSDLEEYFSNFSIVSNSNTMDIEINSADDYDISIYNSLSLQVNIPQIVKSQNNINIDFKNLANGVYFIFLNGENTQKIIRLLLMR